LCEQADLIDSTFDGGSSTCFCFGQTASGKTFTLFGAQGGLVERGGVEDNGGDDFDDCSRDDGSFENGSGVYMLAAKDMLNRLGPRQVLRLSMFEIYHRDVRDLLNQSRELAALEDGRGVMHLKGLARVECRTMEDFVVISNEGRTARATRATGTNATSSRSHAAMLFCIFDRDDSDPASEKDVGRFSLIDLAGAERGADLEAIDKKTQAEGIAINMSMLAFKEVISGMAKGDSNVNFRGSLLTRVLEDSLARDGSKTTVIGCVSPLATESLDTLKQMCKLRGYPNSPKKLKSARTKVLVRHASHKLAEAEADVKTTHQRAERASAEADWLELAVARAEEEDSERAAKAKAMKQQASRELAEAEADAMAMHKRVERVSAEVEWLELAAARAGEGNSESAAKKVLVRQVSRELAVAEADAKATHQRAERASADEDWQDFAAAQADEEYAERAAAARAAAAAARAEAEIMGQASARAAARRDLAASALKAAARARAVHKKEEHLAALLRRVVARFRHLGDAPGPVAGKAARVADRLRAGATLGPLAAHGDALYEALAEFDLEAYCGAIRDQVRSFRLSPRPSLAFPPLTLLLYTQPHPPCRRSHTARCAS
jgi:hypothetical protein